uniref:TIMELESS domain-containing protein n=1 Tax=Meloidogyne hapla TaxID=6305 RepID=A0A1I8B802_MELHA
MDKQIEKEVQSLINTLGFLENGVYYQEPDCFQNVRDLIRHLRRDDRSFNVRRLCNSHNIVKSDLMPIMKSESTSDELFDASLRLAVNLCQPTLAVFENKTPDEAAEWKIYYEIENYLNRTLVAFTDPEIFVQFARKMNKYFDKEWEERIEKERLLVERIFVLLRCVFSIGVEGIATSDPSSSDNSIKSRIIAGFFTSGIEKIFSKLAGDSLENEFSPYILAILALIFKTLDPKSIAYEGEADLQQKSKEAYEKEQASVIQALKLEEERQRKATRRSFLSGSVVVKGMNALNTKRDFVMTSSLLTQNNIPPIAVLSRRKKPHVPPKNRRIDDSYTSENFTQGLQELSPSLMFSIKKFCLNLLLEGKYNRLIKSNRDLVFSRRKTSLKATDFHYFTFATFMLAFSRYSRISCQLVNSTFSIEFFHQITSFLTESFETMKTDKDNIRKYALSSQYAVSVYREIVAMLSSYNPILPEEKEFCNNFCQQLFQTEEYRELAAGILGHLSPAGATRKMLEDLIIANHYFFHLLEKNIKEGTLIRIQKRKRQKKQRKELKKKDNDEKKSIEKAVKMKGIENMWMEITKELSDTLVGEISPNTDVSPINMLLKVDDEQFKEFALLQIQVALRTGRIQDAVGMFRNSRILWPETGTFGNDFDSNEEEMKLLNSIFHEDMKSKAEIYEEALKKAYGREDEEENLINEEKGVDELDIFSSDEEGEREKNKVLEETELDFPQFVLSMAKPTATLFNLLKEIDKDVKNSTEKENRSQHPHFKLWEFGYYLLRNFFAQSEKIEGGIGILACELLFPKNEKEANEIKCGYKENL